MSFPGLFTMFLVRVEIRWGTLGHGFVAVCHPTFQGISWMLAWASIRKVGWGPVDRYIGLG